MNRVFRVGRRRRRLALVVGVVAAVILGLALPASAHSASLSGDTQCFNGDHLVTWHITNSSQTSTLLMAVTSIEAKIGNTTYAVTGYTTPLAKGASTDGTSTVPGGVTGTITATMHTTWPDGITDLDIESVTLEDNCVPPTTTTTSTTTTTTTSTTTTTVPETTTTTVPETTTTTVPETTTTTVPETTTTTVPESTTTVAGSTTIFTTTTTVPETTTTAPETTTTTVPETTTSAGPTTSVLGSTTIFTTTTTAAPTTTTPVTGAGSTVPIPTVINQATTTTVPAGTALPRTGSSSGYALFFGLSCIAGGALLLIRRRRNWIK